MSSLLSNQLQKGRSFVLLSAVSLEASAVLGMWSVLSHYSLTGCMNEGGSERMAE